MLSQILLTNYEPSGNFIVTTVTRRCHQLLFERQRRKFYFRTPPRVFGIQSFNSLCNVTSIISPKSNSSNSGIYCFLFQFRAPFVSLKFTSSYLRLLPRLPFYLSFLLFFSPKKCFGRQFLCKMWQIQLTSLVIRFCRNWILNLMCGWPCIVIQCG